VSDDMTEHTGNRAIAEAFAAQFDPPLTPVSVAKINNVPHRDAWMVATHIREAHPDKSGREFGLTMHAFAGQAHVYLEVLARGKDAGAIGAFAARALASLKEANDDETDQGPEAGEGDPQTDPA
jgi:hypothetical protein